MLKEFETKLNTLINNLTDFYLVLDKVTQFTNNYFNVLCNFKHAIAYATWKWKNYDIWITSNLTKDENSLLQNECILSIYVFDNNNKNGEVYGSIDILKYDENYDVTGYIESETETTDKDAYDTLIKYFTDLREMILHMDNEN